MEHKALYRKYRPKTFADVIGQEHIIETLKNILKTHKIHHAYLFSGPKGTGKTSVAKIFAIVLNCMHTHDLTQACESCLSNYNDNFDIIEMDAASNNGIEEIRDLKEKVEQVPINGHFKVYIIDEVHMLTKSAFNALLKTLEEPPKHVIFILATTDPQKIPLTILSRVQRFNFKRINEQQIVKQLKSILIKEDIKFEENALKALASLASGGMRDALSLAEQASSFNDNKILLEDVVNNFGLMSLQKIIDLIIYLKNNDIINLLKLIQQMQEDGIDPKHFLISILEVLKEWIIFSKTYDVQILHHINQDDFYKLPLNNDLAVKISKNIYDILTKITKSEEPFKLIETGFINIVDLDNSPKIKANHTQNQGKKIPEKNDEINFINQPYKEQVTESPILEENKLNELFTGDDFLKSKFNNLEVEPKTNADINYTDVDETMQHTKELLLKTNEFILSSNEHNGNKEDLESNILTDIDTSEQLFNNTIEINIPHNHQPIKYQWEGEDEMESMLNLVLWIQQDRNNRSTKDVYNKLKQDAEFTNNRVDLNRFFEWFRVIDILVATKNAIIFQCNDDKMIELLNKNKYKVDFQKFIDYVYGDGYKWLYFVNSNDRENIKKLVTEYRRGNYKLKNPIHQPKKLINVIPNDREDQIEASKYIYKKTWKS
ncbi:DNA polymerase III subunit gamma/tau [Mycoplasma sp. 246B]